MLDLARLLGTFRPGDVHLWQGSIAALSEADTCLLDDDERRRAQAFRYAEDRQAFISRRIGVKRILGFYLGRPAAEIGFSVGRFGKPYLPVAEEVSFNWSKSANLWLLAIAPGGNIGVDIEYVAEDIDWQSLLPLVCHESEIRFIAQERAGAVQRFFQIWARKEALIKALGKGIRDDLPSLSVMPATTGNGGVPRNFPVQDAIDLQIEPGLAGAIVADFPIERLRRFAWPAAEIAECIMTTPFSIAA